MVEELAISLSWSQGNGSAAWLIPWNCTYSTAACIWCSVSQACSVWVDRATSRRIAGLHKNFSLLVSPFQASIWALNRKRGDTPVPDRETVLTLNTSQQCAEMLLMSLRLNRPPLDKVVRGYPPLARQISSVISCVLWLCVSSFQNFFFSSCIGISSQMLSEQRLVASA